MSYSMGKNVYIAESAVIAEDTKIGNNVQIGENVIIKSGVVIRDNVIIGEECVIAENVYIDLGVIIRDNVTIGKNTFIGARCIIGEYLVEFIQERDKQKHKTVIGENSLLRSETIIYGENNFGHDLQTGHRVTIRENSRIGHNVRIGTLSDIQGNCDIGNYVNMHSNVHIGQKSVVKDYVWIFPYVVLTNDPNPPSEELLGVTVEEYAVIATGTVVLPGQVIKSDALVGAGAIVNKNVEEETVVVGNPIRKIGDVKNIKNKVTGEAVYPWRYHFDRGMPWKEVGIEQWESENKVQD